MNEKGLNQAEAVRLLNRIMETELAGVVRYTHYSLMVFGYGRIPIVSWLRDQAQESLKHAQEAGELVTHFGEHPSLGMGPLLESHRHDIGDILRESMEHERAGLEHYRQLFELVEGRSVLLEEYARSMISAEERHVSEVDKMLRQPGAVASATESRVGRSRGKSSKQKR